MMPPKRFFLGGRDLEMVEIARLLAERGETFVDHGLAWGASLSAYAALIGRAVSDGCCPVAVELADDMPVGWVARGHLIIVDHHGARAGETRPTSLEQVAALIGAEDAARTRWLMLVSANDRGYIDEMKAIGATADEIRTVRGADRRAQNVTVADEAAARAAIAGRQTVGRLTVVTVNSPSSTAVSDFVRPELGGPGSDRLLVVLPEKLAAYGDGDMIAALVDAAPTGWWGGALPARGFWGVDRAGAPPVKDIIELIRGIA